MNYTDEQLFFITYGQVAMLFILFISSGWGSEAELKSVGSAKDLRALLKRDRFVWGKIDLVRSAER